jgi:hypothetical protein
MKYRAIGAIASFLLLPACSAPPATPPADDVSEGSATDATPKAEADGTADIVPLNTATTVRDDREITITQSEIVESLQGNQLTQPIEAKGGKLIIVYMTIANTGSESGNMMFSQFKLTDDQGRSYEAITDFNDLTTFAVWTQAKGLDDTNADIFPGGQFNIAKIFRVATDAENLTMEVNGTRFAIQ